MRDQDNAAPLGDESAERSYRQAQEALRESEQMFSAMTASARDAIVMIDHEGAVTYWNEAAERMFGFSREEIENKILYMFVIPERFREAHEKGFSEFVRTGQGPFIGKTFEVDGRRKDGTEFPLELSLSAVSLHGKWNALSIMRDITERRQAEEALRESRERLRNLASRLQAVREEERTILAREIHDALGQDLVALKMDLAWLTPRLPVDQEPLQASVRSMDSLLDSALSTVRKIAAGLRPALLDDLGLEAAIQWQATEFGQRTEIRCEMHLDTEGIGRDLDRDTALFRIFQEALTNVGRHAEASHVQVTLQSNAGEIVLVVSDDGKGIGADQVASHESLGLIGMHERAKSRSGHVEIQPRPEGGTRVAVTMPL